MDSIANNITDEMFALIKKIPCIRVYNIEKKEMKEYYPTPLNLKGDQGFKEFVKEAIYY